jgi:hypothetical protein
MIVYNPQHSYKDSKAIYSADIYFLKEKKELYFTIDKQFSFMLTKLSDPLLVSLLIPCMREKEKMTIMGSISRSLYENIDKIQDILCAVNPCLTKIEIEINNVVEEKQVEESAPIISGFSAGVDAFVTFEDYFLKPKYNKKITHFLFNNLTYGRVKRNLKVKRIYEFKEECNFNLIETYTNFHHFYKPKKQIGFEQTHTIRNAAIAHFLGAAGNNFLYSSTFHKDLIEIKKYYDLSIVDNILLPLLSTKSIECESVGSEYTRLEKTLKVANIDYAHSYLDTCIGKPTNRFINCGTCRKCTRALLTFELVNKEKLFKEVFNFSEWYKIRDLYIKELPDKEQLNDKELYLYIKENCKGFL